jgi:hypothetical protein
MEIDDEKIVSLKNMVKAAQEEFDMAVSFHEIWKPAAYDQDLHNRLGNSYATQAFLVMRSALKREVVLALMRLWDTTGKSVRMELIWQTLREKGVIDALARDRASHMGLTDVLEFVREDLAGKANKILELIGKYRMDGPSHTVLSNLRTLRNERLAHRQTNPSLASATGATTTDTEIEEFYQDNSKIIQLLLSLVSAMAYNPQDTAGVFGFYAKSFWERIQPDQRRGTLQTHQSDEAD